MNTTAASVAPPELVQTPAQLKQRLWADPTVTVYAVAMAARLPDLPARLAAAVQGRELADYDCLWPGAVPAARQREAPYLLTLQRVSPFTDWLLFEAAAGLGPWGVVVRSPVARLTLRSHLRQLLRARLLDGSVVPLDWMDPEVLPLLLPHFDAAGLQAFAGPVTDWVLPLAGGWPWSRLVMGRLEQQRWRLPAVA